MFEWLVWINIVYEDIDFAEVNCGLTFDYRPYTKRVADRVMLNMSIWLFTARECRKTNLAG